MLSPEEIAKKWQRNTAGAGESVRAGVQSVTVAPTAAAAAKIPEYLIGVQRAVDSGKLEAGLRRVSLEDWKNATINKGLPRLAAGVAQAEPKVREFMADFLPHVSRGVEIVKAMPKGTLADGIARATAMIEHLAKYKRK